MDIFQKQKAGCMERLDKSKKGSVDEAIVPLVKLINNLPDYYTTSSCAGRIIIMAIGPSGRKDETEWLLASHSEIKIGDTKTALKNLPKEQVWFMAESFILHIACKDFEAANEMVRMARKCGLKRSGVIAAEKMFTIEIMGNERIETIIAEKEKLLVNEEYLKTLVREANKKLRKTRQKMKKLEEGIRKVPS